MARLRLDAETAAIQDVREPSVQPRFAGHGIMTAVDRFVQDVCIVTAKTTDFLIEPTVSVVEQAAVTPIP